MKYLFHFLTRFTLIVFDKYIVYCEILYDTTRGGAHSGPYMAAAITIRVAKPFCCRFGLRTKNSYYNGHNKISLILLL